MQSHLALEAVEKQLEDVSAAMLAGDPVALEQCSAQLRLAIAGFSQVMESVRGRPLPADIAARIQRASERLAMQRDNLARVAAVVDRQVASVLPPADNTSTYGKTGAAPGSVAARIYRSAG